MEKGKVSRIVKLYTLIILILLYIAIVSFPFALWIDDIYCKIIDMSLKATFIVIAFISIKRYELENPQVLPNKSIKLLLLIPLVVLTFSNWIYVWIFKAPLHS